MNLFVVWRWLNHHQNLTKKMKMYCQMTEGGCAGLFCISRIASIAFNCSQWYFKNSWRLVSLWNIAIQSCICVTGLHETPFLKLPSLFQPEGSIVYLCAIQYQALDAFITTESQNDNDADKLWCVFFKKVNWDVKGKQCFAVTK